MATITGDLILGIFERQEQANTAIHALRDAGFAENEVGLIAKHAPDAHSNRKLLEGIEAGALTGAGLVGAWALLIATSTLPAIGPIVAAGALAALVAGGVIGGGVVGALVSLGLPEHEARYHHQALSGGRIIVSVHSASRQQEAAQLLNQHGAENIGPPPADAPIPAHTPHLNLTPGHLHERDLGTTPGGFTPTGGLGSTTYQHDSPREFHMPGSEEEPS
jgi:hypothetical protein